MVVLEVLVLLLLQVINLSNISVAQLLHLQAQDRGDRAQSESKPSLLSMRCTTSATHDASGIANMLCHT